VCLQPSASAPSPVPISIETRAMATPEPVELAPTVSLEELIPKYSTLTTDGLNRVSPCRLLSPVRSHQITIPRCLMLWTRMMRGTSLFHSGVLLYAESLAGAMSGSFSVSTFVSHLSWYETRSKNLKLRTDLGLQLKLFQLLDDSGNGQVALGGAALLPLAVLSFHVLLPRLIARNSCRA
jgi:hypothetical protein